MPEDVKFDEPQESSPELAEALASSPEVKQEAQQQLDTQAGTAQQPESQETEQAKEVETPFHEHPRFKECFLFCQESPLRLDIRNLRLSQRTSPERKLLGQC